MKSLFYVFNVADRPDLLETCIDRGMFGHKKHVHVNNKTHRAWPEYQISPNLNDKSWFYAPKSICCWTIPRVSLPSRQIKKYNLLQDSEYYSIINYNAWSVWFKKLTIVAAFFYQKIFWQTSTIFHSKKSTNYHIVCFKCKIGFYLIL